MYTPKLALPLLLALSALQSLPVGAESHRFVFDVRTAPPAPRVEVVPAARRGWAWAPGHWGWRHHRYVWVRGHWIHARYGYRWAEPRWVEYDGRWRFQRGHWERG